MRIDEGAVQLSTATLEMAQNLCSGEPFLAEPAAAYCTGALVDDDLLITAAHCMGSLSECRALRIVFDYVYGADGLVEATAAGVYDCRAFRHPTDADWVAVQLDRPVDGSRARLPLTNDAVAPGDHLVGASHGQGLPLKIDPDAFVTAATSDVSFEVATDAFGGASGSPLLDGDGRLVGILQRGRVDYIEEGDCRVHRNVDAAEGAETATRATALRQELCATGWPSEVLCARAPTCGDGICSASESPGLCSVDCTEPACGDGLCELPERKSCPADCAPPSEPGVPFEWYCDPAWYGARDGCDCACGTDDPDCEGRRCGAFGPGRRALPPRAPASSAPSGSAPPDAGPDATTPARSGVSVHGGCAITGPPSPTGSQSAGWAACLALSGVFVRRDRRPRPRRQRRWSSPAMRWIGALLLVACGGSRSPSAATCPAERLEGASSERSPRPTTEVAPVPLGQVASHAFRSVLELEVRAAPTENTSLSRSSSGVLVSEQGDVVTNAHGLVDGLVVEAIAHDGRLLDARVIASDPDTDLALLRVSGDLAGLEPLRWATSLPPPGASVLLVGNALGRGLVANSGIVSAIGGTDLGHARYEDYVITDAHVVRGVSGGALVDARGLLVGVAVGALDDGQVGGLLGLAISLRLARPVTEQLVTSGVVERGHLGLELADVDTTTARRLGTRARGAVVLRVDPGGPADRAGLRTDDVITQAAGWNVRHRGNARAALSTVGADDTVSLVVTRAGSEVELRLTAGRAPSVAGDQTSAPAADAGAPR
jgi:S1-C subfamily serine protease